MIAFKGVPYQISPYDTDRYWMEDWPFMHDYMPGNPPPILRAWLVEDKKAGTTQTKQQGSASKVGTNLANARWAKQRILRDKAREMAVPLIARGNLQHNDIAKELEKIEKLKF